jgi:hypothetical protein
MTKRRNKVQREVHIGVDRNEEQGAWRIYAECPDEATYIYVMGKIDGVVLIPTEAELQGEGEAGASTGPEHADWTPARRSTCT